jgi:hypothetical protein
MAYHSLDDAASQRRISNSHDAPETVQPRPFAASDPSTQPGLELAPISGHDKQVVNPVDEGDKEVVREEAREVSQSDDMSYAPLVQSDGEDWDAGRNSQKPAKGRRLCGLTRKAFWSVLAVVMGAITLAVGLGVALTSRHSDAAPMPSSTPEITPSSTTKSSATPTAASKQLQIGGSIDPAYYSTSGAWNGSGIAYVWQNFTQHWDDILASNEYSHVVYFQDVAGDLRWMRQTADYSWKEGSEDLVIVAEDARNSTPIAAAQYTADGVNYWSVFCEFLVAQWRLLPVCVDGLVCGVLTACADIDTDNFVRQRSGNNETAGWSEGSISKVKLTAWDGDLVGLSACESAANQSAPVRLFYASNSTAFEEYTWWAERDEWEWERTWEGYSTAANVGCYTGSDNYRYVGLVNRSNRLEIWYQSVEDSPDDWQKGQHIPQTFCGRLLLTSYLSTTRDIRRTSRLIARSNPGICVLPRECHKRHESRSSRVGQFLHTQWHEWYRVACIWSLRDLGHPHERQTERELHLDFLSAKWARCHLARAFAERGRVEGGQSGFFLLIKLLFETTTSFDRMTN